MIREIRGAQAEALRELNCSPMGENIFARHYRKHDEWLNKAILEIKSGRRVAFGAYSSENSSKLIASVVLKRGLYTEEVEIKNLLVAGPDPLATEEGRILLRDLLEKVKEFSQLRGFTSLASELPVDAHGYVSFFLAQGFHVQAARESPYSKFSKIYVLSQELMRPYVGDPFDLVSFVRWALDEIFQFQLDLTKNPDEAVLQINGMYAIPFVIPAGGASRKGLASNILDLHGYCYLHEGGGAEPLQIAMQNHGRVDLRIVVTTENSDSLREHCRREKISLLQLDDLAALSGPGCLVGQLPAIDNCEQIGGLLIGAGPSIQEQIKECDSYFMYILPNGHGTNLKPGDYVLFVANGTLPSGESELLVGALAKVASAVPYNSDHAWKEIENQPRLWTKPEYTRFFETFHANQEVLKRVAVLNLQEVKYLETPVPAGSLLQEEEYKAIKDLWHSQHLTDCYFSTRSAGHITKLIQAGPTRFHDGRKSFGGLYLQALLTAIEQTAESYEDSLELIEELRQQFGSGATDAISHHARSNTMSNSIEDFFVKTTMDELGLTLKKLSKTLKDKRYDPVARNEFRVRTAYTVLSILEPLMGMKDLNPLVQVTFKKIQDYFQSIIVNEEARAPKLNS